ncbi:MAG: hypothetical protein HUK09_03280 [Bacteroidaceae bacterium]|nr:hypothetical protein [Bacteroidaceae bacterium]
MNTQDPTSTPNSTPAQQPEIPQSSDNQPTKRKSKKGWIIAFLFLVLLGGGGAAAYLYYQQQQETIAYQTLFDNEQIADYEDYLERYPTSGHAEEVKRRLAKLKQMYAAWERIQNSSYISDFERFKQDYPGTLLVKQCDLRIDSLDWVEATKSNSPEAFERYIQRHPNGRYLAEATNAQSTLANAKPTDLEMQQINATLQGFFEAFGANDEAELMTHITPTMTRFLNLTNATKAEVTDLISSTYNDHITNCNFVLNNDYNCTKRTDETNSLTYTVTFSVDQFITRDNPGKTFGSYTAVAQLNNMFKITSLTMTEVSRRNAAPTAEEQE